MGILSSSAAITRYRVEGEIETHALESIEAGLRRYTITEIDGEDTERSMGWTSFGRPFAPDFTDSAHVVGAYLVFCLRMDKKSIPAAIVKKHVLAAESAKLADTGREHLSKNERQEIKEAVIARLSRRIPAAPSVYDLIWNLEEKWLWFFTNQKAANEALETLFSKSFTLQLVRLFPYTIAEGGADLTPEERDRLPELTPTRL